MAYTIVLKVFSVVQVQCSRNFTFLLMENGNLWSFGYNRGQLGLGTSTGAPTNPTRVPLAPEVKVRSLGKVLTFLFL